MRINRELEYGLLSITALSQEAVILSARVLSGRFRIPLEILSKILQRMAQAGLIDSVQGPKGGYRMSRSLDEITLGEAVRAIQGPVQLTLCQGDDRTCLQEEACTIRSGIHGLQDKLAAYLNRHSLKDLLEAPGPLETPSATPSR